MPAVEPWRISDLLAPRGRGEVAGELKQAGPRLLDDAVTTIPAIQID